MGLDKTWQLAVAPTDTVWGLLCRIDTEQAQNNIDRVYQLKQRDRSKALILFARDIDSLKPYVEDWSPLLDSLAKRYWPGALTLVAKRSLGLPTWINSTEDYIGMRIARSPSIDKLLADTSNGVLLSTSANLSSQPPVCNYQEACELFAGSVDLILDSPELGSNQASTVAKIQGDSIEILRQGDIKLDISDILR